ncbi:MAG: tripartite tricarboxylate transporter substrate binding protein [Rhodospirillales bacterium]|nr:tripartite tricarboxylate transporter substrate binding protein [Rhodospirillales bacterium]
MKGIGRPIGRRRALAMGAAVAAAPAGLVSPAFSQGAFPDRSIRLVVGFPPGGSTDVAARMLASRMSETLGQQVVVDNKPGVAGNIASQIVADANPDGYTLLVGNSNMGTVPALYDKLPYDPVKGLEPVAHFQTIPMILVAPIGGAKNIKELIEMLRKEPGKYSYATAGTGSNGHLMSYLFIQRAGGDALQVNYRGNAPAMQDLLAGRHAFLIDTVATSKGFLDANRITLLGIGSEQRLASLPDVPTVQEQAGFPFRVRTWSMLFAPAGTPRPIVEILNAAANKAVAHPDFIEKTKGMGIELIQSTPDTAKAFYLGEMEFWAPIVKASGIKVE